ncbi:MAG: nuclear transport factor 2 family protein [Mariniblastus sp.]|nr:nuclear transport factor 2 family protein [Mariniblastus sp.]
MEPEQSIKTTIQTYCDGLYESDGKKIHQAFHPKAKVTGYFHGELAEFTVESLAEMVDKQTPSDAAQELPKLCEIISLSQAGQTAAAVVRDRFMGLTFLDTLSLLKVDNDWVIYNKLFHVEA